MSDRYTFHDESMQPNEEEEVLGALLARHAARTGQEWTNMPPPLVERLVRMELERQSAYEEEPIRPLSPRQRERLWAILRDEAGPAAAVRIIKRVENEA